jgi:ribose transport system permease protein
MSASADRARRGWLDGNPWVWSLLGAVVVWLLTAISVHMRGAGETLATALGFGTFYVAVGLGQMLVIAAGPGNIDLSIPSVMTLAGYLSMGAMGAQNSGLILGVAIALGVGLGAGAANVVLIRLLNIPPMIATLASGFVMQSITIAYSRGSTAKPAPLLLTASLARVADVPVIALAFLAVAVAVAFVLARSVVGRSVLAVGQNIRAAYLAGVRIERTLAAVYVLSALLAAVAGLLLAAYSGGASLNMSEDFLLMSIAVVVLGGTSIAGGQATVAGVWTASLFLYLIVTMLNVFGVGAGLRYVITGLIIIFVLAVSKDRRTA